MKTGLVSVTFRQLTSEQIIGLVAEAGLDGIEWGSDIHCPVGDFINAQNVFELMQQNNLETISYGSYYRVGEHDNFADVLATAVILKAPNIRVWAGSLDSEKSATDYRQKLVADGKNIVQMAQEKGISVSFEYHGGTLTNTQQSTLQLLQEIDSPNSYTYWQPLNNTSFEQNLRNISELVALKKLSNIHAYHWKDGNRLALSDGVVEWNEYLKFEPINAVLIEFVKDDSIEQFKEDAKTIKELLV